MFKRHKLCPQQHWPLTYGHQNLTTESEWTFVQNVKKSLHDNLEISRSDEWDREANGRTTWEHKALGCSSPQRRGCKKTWHFTTIPDILLSASRKSVSDQDKNTRCVRYDFQQHVPKRENLTLKFHKLHVWIIERAFAWVGTKIDVFKCCNFHIAAG